MPVLIDAGESAGYEPDFDGHPCFIAYVIDIVSREHKNLKPVAQVHATCFHYQNAGCLYVVSHH